MPGLIESYAVIGNCETAALVGRDGSIDWLGLPRFDSAACFAALLGGPRNGRWLIAPAPRDPQATPRHRHREGTLILETAFETAEGAAVLVDGMGRRDDGADLVRVVRGVRGRTAFRTELALRFEYGVIVPWTRRLEDGRLTAVAGPDRVTLGTPVGLRGEGLTTVAEFAVGAGEEVPFVLTWSPSYRPIPAPADAGDTVETATAGWKGWTECYKAEGSGEWSEAVRRSLFTLKARP